MDEARLREAAEALVRDAWTAAEQAELHLRALLRETVRECEEAAQWAERSATTHANWAIRERFKWLGGGD